MSKGEGSGEGVDSTLESGFVYYEQKIKRELKGLHMWVSVECETKS